MQISTNVFVDSARELLDTDDFCIYVAKNPFWADCKSNELICDVEGKNAIAVNMVDADTPQYFQPKIFRHLVRLIADKVGSGNRVRIMCNKGVSRSASVGLLYVAAIGEISKENYESAAKEFKKIYPNYSPNRGIKQFLANQWHQFFRPKSRNDEY